MLNGMRFVRFCIIIVTLTIDFTISISAQTIKNNNVSCNVLIDNVLLYARSKLGCTYEWGGDGPAYDCSGLVYYAYKQAGINLKRTSRTLSEEGDYVLLTHIKKGDLVFFLSGDDDDKHITHVGIAVSNYNDKDGDFLFIHSSKRNNGVYINHFTDYNYQTTYAGARRIIRCD